MLVYAIIFITSALILYTIGVWSEKTQGDLKRWHLLLFYLGLIFDTLGTIIMSEISKGGFQFNFHGITGLLAIILMFLHALWATIVLIKNDKKDKSNFHQFSFIVWMIWLIPFISGAILGISK